MTVRRLRGGACTVLMVIMGAGASYDSAPSLKPLRGRPDPYRLPLADGLFEKRSEFRNALNRYRQIHPIVPYLRERGTDSLEEVLQNLYENSSNHPERVKQMIALRFYIADIVHECSTNWLKEADGITNHKTLIDQILEFRTERVLFVTFNYDELIEDALSDHKFRTKYLEDYITISHQFSLYKLHGSMGWIRLVMPTTSTLTDLDDMISEVASYGGQFDSDSFRIFDAIPRSLVEGWLAVPAIAIPIFRKSRFECPSSHLKNLTGHLPRVDKILAIGWRAKEEHFLSLLSTHLRMLRGLWVVSMNDASTILQSLQNALQSKLHPEISMQSFDGGFTSFVTERAGRGLFAI